MSVFGKILPEQSIKGIWILSILVLVMVAIIFLNKYMGPNKEPLFGFLKKTTATPAA